MGQSPVCSVTSKGAGRIQYTRLAAACLVVHFDLLLINPMLLVVFDFFNTTRTRVGCGSHHLFTALHMQVLHRDPVANVK